MKEIAYCGVCSYPLLDDGCRNCKADKENRARESEVRRSKMQLYLGGAKAMNEYTYSSFSQTLTNRAAFTACATFLPFESTDNLYIYSSGNGTGKTHLAVIALRRMLELNSTGRLLKPSWLYRILRSSKEAKDEIAFVASLIDLDVFVLDDIDAAKDSEFTLQTLYDVIDGRYMKAKGGLIITANSSLEELEKRWRNSRIISRLHEMCGKNIYCLDSESDHRRRK